MGELNGNTRYQILNSTGVSSLKWPEINGMYVFAATVVARDYRYDNNSAIMQLSMSSPTSPCKGIGGARWGFDS